MVVCVLIGDQLCQLRKVNKERKEVEKIDVTVILYICYFSIFYKGEFRPKFDK